MLPAISVIIPQLQIHPSIFCLWFRSWDYKPNFCIDKCSLIGSVKRGHSRETAKPEEKEGTSSILFYFHEGLLTCGSCDQHPNNTFSLWHQHFVAAVPSSEAWGPAWGLSSELRNQHQLSSASSSDLSLETLNSSILLPSRDRIYVPPI